MVEEQGSQEVALPAVRRKSEKLGKLASGTKRGMKEVSSGLEGQPLGVEAGTSKIEHQMSAMSQLYSTI